jgi:hypothetical protein
MCRWTIDRNIGFDLVPINKKVDTWRTNCTGWYNLTKAIEMLGGDVTSASCHNEGKRVLKKTAIAWGKLLEDGIKSGRLKRYQPFNGFLVDDPDGQDFTEPDLRYILSFVVFCEFSSGFRQC